MLVPFRLTEDALTGDVDLDTILEKIQALGAFFSPSSNLHQTDLPSLVRAIPDQHQRKLWKEALRQKTIRVITCPGAPLHIPTSFSLTDLSGCGLLILGTKTGAPFDLSRDDPRCDFGKLELILGARIGASVKMKNAKEAAAGIFKAGTKWKDVWDTHFAPYMTCASKIQVFDKHAGKEILNERDCIRSSLFRLIKHALDICESPHIEIYTSFDEEEPSEYSSRFLGLEDRISTLKKETDSSTGAGKVEFYVIPKSVGKVQTYHDRGAIINGRWLYTLGKGLEAQSKNTVNQPYGYRYDFMTNDVMQSLRDVLGKWKADATAGKTEAKPGYWTEELWLGGG